MPAQIIETNNTPFNKIAIDPVTLDIIRDLGHALTHEAICRGSLRLLQGIYERRRATLH